MNIRLATNRDASNWNHYVSSHPSATPYHHYAWKTAIVCAYQHQAYYFIAEDQDKNITGILPSIKIKPPFLSGKLSALPFCDVGEALANNEDIKNELIHYALNVSKSNNLTTFEYRASSTTQNDDLTGKKVRMLLALPSSSEVLLKGFKSKHRSQINKAKKNGLTIKLGRENELLDAFYDVFSQNMRKLGSPVHSKKFFQEILRHYGENIIISTIWINQQITGAGIVLLNGSKASIPWASTIAEYNKLAPNMLLYWSLLEYVSDNGYEQFDFGRSTVDEGTYRFKKQWGAKPQLLDWQNYQSGILELSDEISSDHTHGKLRSFIEKIWQQLPLKITLWIGPKVRKYISL